MVAKKNNISAITNICYFNSHIFASVFSLLECLSLNISIKSDIMKNTISYSLLMSDNTAQCQFSAPNSFSVDTQLPSCFLLNAATF